MMKRYGKMFVIPCKGHKNMHTVLMPEQHGGGFFGAILKAGARMIGKTLSSRNVQSLGRKVLASAKQTGMQFAMEKKNELVKDITKRGEDVVGQVLAGKNIRDVAKGQASDIARSVKDLPASEARKVKARLVKEGKSRLSDAITSSMMRGKGVGYV
jgi:hypothetical protein